MPLALQMKLSLKPGQRKRQFIAQCVFSLFLSGQLRTVCLVLASTHVALVTASEAGSIDHPFCSAS